MHVFDKKHSQCTFAYMHINVNYIYLHVINALSVGVLGLQVEFGEGEGHSLAFRLPEHVSTVHVVPVVAIEQREVHCAGGLFYHSPAHYKTIQCLKQGLFDMHI